MKVTSKLTLTLARALAAAVIWSIAPALAQQGATEIEEVVVKARKREESLQDVPIVITTFTEMTIRRVGIERSEDFISPVPNMTIVDTAGIGDTQVSVRGIVSTPDAESTIA